MRAVRLFFIYAFVLSAMIESLAQGSWATKAPLPAAGRWAPVAFAIGAKGYLGTGMAASGTLSDFWEYDPVANSWTQKANFGGGVRSAAVGFAIGNYGFAGTGKDAGTNYFNDLWKYDPALNTWTQVATMTGVARNMAFGFCAAGKGYVGTGKTSTGGMLNDLWEYDPITDTWAAKANYVGGNRMDIDKAVFVICNKAYLGTGFDGSDKNDFWEYDPLANTWVQKANFPGTPRSGATGFAIGSRGYLGLGASNIITYFTNYWKYNPVTNTWSPIPAFPGTARFDAPSFVINNKAYVGTGSENLAPVTYFNDLREYTPDSVIGGNLQAAIQSTASVVCTGQSITLTASGGTSYSWSNGSTNNPIVVTPSTTTTYSVTVTDIFCNATATASITITAGSLAAIVTGSSTICAGQSATLTASGGNNYAWSNGSSTSFITPAPTATTTYSVIVSAGSCSDTGFATVTVNAAPPPLVTGNTSVCTGDVATLTASGGNSYSWSTGSSGAVITTSPASTTSYTVTATQANGCTSSTTLTVSVTSAVTAGILCGNVCGSDSAILVASGGATYLWSTGAATNSITVSPAASASYSVIVSIGSCADTATCTVNVFAAPNVTAAPDTTIQTGATATLTAAGGGTYAWSNGSTGNIIYVSPLVTTQYTVTATDANGCTGISVVTITVDDPCSMSAAGELYLPNAFSPNNDGENDVLQIYYGDFNCLESFILTVYNRWGEKVFETTDVNSLWDGTHSDKADPINPAVFSYYLKATLVTGDVITKKGNISLMR